MVFCYCFSAFLDRFNILILPSSQALRPSLANDGNENVWFFFVLLSQPLVLSQNVPPFFQPEEGGKQQQQYNSQYLEKIIEILQSSPLLAYRQVGVNGVFKSNAPPSGSTQCWPFNKGTGMEYGHESTSELC